MSSLPEVESRLLMERERPMSASEWRVKAEERKRMKLLRRLEKLANSADSGTRLMDPQIPLHINCQLNDGLVQFAPLQLGSFTYDGQRQGSRSRPMIRERASGRQECEPVTDDLNSRGRVRTRMECVREENEDRDESPRLDTAPERAEV